MDHVTLCGHLSDKLEDIGQGNTIICLVGQCYDVQEKPLTLNRFEKTCQDVPRCVSLLLPILFGHSHTNIWLNLRSLRSIMKKKLRQ